MYSFLLVLLLALSTQGSDIFENHALNDETRQRFYDFTDDDLIGYKYASTEQRKTYYLKLMTFIEKSQDLYETPLQNHQNSLFQQLDQLLSLVSNKLAKPEAQDNINNIKESIINVVNDYIKYSSVFYDTLDFAVQWVDKRKALDMEDIPKKSLQRLLEEILYVKRKVYDAAKTYHRNVIEKLVNQEILDVNGLEDIIKKVKEFKFKYIHNTIECVKNRIGRLMGKRFDPRCYRLTATWLGGSER